MRPKKKSRFINFDFAKKIIDAVASLNQHVATYILFKIFMNILEYLEYFFDTLDSNKAPSQEASAAGTNTN
jgi:hypothetical protein